MVPIVSGVSFELIQWAGRTDSRLADILSKPGLGNAEAYNQRADSRYG